MYPKGIYFCPKYLRREYFKANVHAIRVHGPRGIQAGAYAILMLRKT